MVVLIAGKRMYLWRTVDHEGEVLDMLVQRRRDKRGRSVCCRQALKKQGFCAPTLLTTDKLGSTDPLSGTPPELPSRAGLRANNRAENSHQSRATTRA